MSDRPEYLLYCMAQSGNCYRVALMLNLIGADWKPVFVDFFVAGEQRTEKFRTEVNELGEIPVLDHGGRKLSQSAVCLTYLAKHSGKFRPRARTKSWNACAGSFSTTRRSTAFSGLTAFSRTSRRRRCRAPKRS
jgi:glutathione S-transferase